MKYKHERTEKLIRNEIMSLITEKKLKDPRIPGFIVITKMKVSKDFHYSLVYFTALEQKVNKKSIQDGLNSARGFIQKVIAEKLQLRFTPKLEFRYDFNEEKAYQVDDLLAKISNSRNENAPEAGQ